MISKLPVKAIEIINHALDQSAILELAAKTDNSGITEVLEIDLHFSNTEKARTITLYKMIKNSSLKVVIYQSASSTAEYIHNVFTKPVILMDDETIQLEVTKPDAPCPGTVVNGSILIQSKDKPL